MTDENSARPRPIASMPYMTQNSDAPVRTKPSQSSGRSVSSFGLSKNIVTSACTDQAEQQVDPLKIQRHEKCTW